MCGIAGVISADLGKVSRDTVLRMTAAIKHRGPEQEGVWANNENTVCLGHRRLSIIDLSSAGEQPMHYAGRYTITYNGELYNYLEIKQELLKKGYSFKSESDTEVILAAYAAYREDCLNRFDGMFAFAIFDNYERTLFFARDRFGEKPFYYHFDKKGASLFFGSEIKAIKAAGVELRINDEMLLHYLGLGLTSNPIDTSETFYINIKSLPPAHYAVCKINNQKIEVEISQYWDIDKETVSPITTFGEIKEQFLDLLATSVTRRLRSDVAVGSSLSGGLDSSTIVALVNQQLKNTGSQKTFSAVFPGFEKDESREIATVAERYQLENFKTTPTAPDFISDFSRLCWHQDEPFQSASIYAQYKVYKLAKEKGVTVILDGQGADEMLAGYDKYYHWYWQELIEKGHFAEASKERKAAARNNRKINWGPRNYIAAFAPGMTAQKLEKRAFQKLMHSSDLNQEFVQAHEARNSIYKPPVAKLNDILYFNTMRSGLSELLRYADRNSMAHSREVRLPFLYHELVQFIFSIPAKYKIKDGFTKYVLRSCMTPVLPASIVWRKDKVGFEPPQQQWMENKNTVEFVIESRRRLVEKGILNKSVLQKPVMQKSAHEGDNYDWRYLCAAQYL